MLGCFTLNPEAALFITLHHPPRHTVARYSRTLPPHTHDFLGLTQPCRFGLAETEIFVNFLQFRRVAGGAIGVRIQDRGWMGLKLMLPALIRLFPTANTALHNDHWYTHDVGPSFYCRKVPVSACCYCPFAGLQKFYSEC